MGLGDITSSIAYRYNVGAGILSARRRQVYVHLCSINIETGRAATSAEVWKSIARTNPGIPQHSINPRFVELKRQLVVREDGIVACSVTGRECVGWEAIMDVKAIDVPRARKPKTTHARVAQLEEQLREASETIVSLRKELARNGGGFTLDGG